jgi:phosphohistidine phosphatase
VLCSSAERARQTWDLVSDHLGDAVTDGQVVRYDPRLYGSDVTDLVEIIRETPADMEILALVGHNPGSGALVHTLIDQQDLRFPTSAVAVIEFRGDWAQVAPGAGTLAGYWTPKGGSVVPRG